MGSAESNTTERLSTHSGCAELAGEKTTELLTFPALIEQYPEEDKAGPPLPASSRSVGTVRGSEGIRRAPTPGCQRPAFQAPRTPAKTPHDCACRQPAGTSTATLPGRKGQRGRRAPASSSAGAGAPVASDFGSGTSSSTWVSCRG